MNSWIAARIKYNKYNCLNKHINANANEFERKINIRNESDITKRQKKIKKQVDCVYLYAVVPVLWWSVCVWSVWLIQPIQITFFFFCYFLLLVFLWILCVCAFLYFAVSSLYISSCIFSFFYLFYAMLCFIEFALTAVSLIVNQFALK